AVSELPPEAARPLGGALEALAQLGITRGHLAPVRDTAGRLEPGDGGDEPRARQVIGGRKGPTRVVVGRLFGDGRATERTAQDDAPESARRAAQLPLDDRTVIHRLRS